MVYSYPGIPQAPITLIDSPLFLFYASNNVIFKFEIAIQNSCSQIDKLDHHKKIKFCAKNTTSHFGPIRSIHFYNNKIATCGDDKILAILDTNLNCLHKRLFNKKLAAAHFFDSYLLVSDRFGDIYRINDDLSGEAEIFFSHYTTITTSLLAGYHLLTGNKDGKVVALDASEPCTVNYICLGHSEFITCLAACKDNMFLSCSADGKLRLWSFDGFSELALVDLGKMAFEHFGPGTYVPFQILSSTDDYCISVLFTDSGGDSFMLIVDIGDLKKHRWIKLPFKAQSAVLLSNTQVLGALTCNFENEFMLPYCFVDIAGNLWTRNNSNPNECSSLWNKIEMEETCPGELVNFWKSTEHLRSSAKPSGNNPRD